MNWDHLHPDAGTWVNLSASLATLDAVHTAAGDAQTQVNAGTATIPSPEWSGDSRAAWREKGDGIYFDMSDFVAAFPAAKSAVSAYISEFQSIEAAADHERQKLAHAQHIVNMPPTNPFDPIATAEESVKKTVATYQMAEAETALVMLGNRRQSADDALVAALGKALPTSWTTTKATLKSLGLDSPGDLTPSAVATAMAKLARDAETLGNTDAQQALAGMLTIYGRDPQVMSKFFHDLGGADTLGLVDTLGDQYGRSLDGDQDSLALAQALRAGLAVGSGGWDTAEATAFAQQMFNGTPTTVNVAWGPGSQVPALGFLFNDPQNALMGKALTIAAADQADIFERDHHGSLVAEPGLAGGIGGQVVSGGSFLSGADHGVGAYEAKTPGGTPYWTAGTDAAGRIFDSLAHYPDAAYDWLTQGLDPAHPGQDSDRLNYWFADRDWSKYDQFTGPASLFESAALSHDAKSELGTTMTSHILWDLSTNDSYSSTNMSDDAARDIAGGVAGNFQQIVSALLSNGEMTGPGLGHAPNIDNSSMLVPGVTAEEMAKLLQGLAVHHDAASVLGGAAHYLQGAYLSYAYDHPGDANAVANALSYGGAVQAVIDGAGMGGALDDAAGIDAASDKAIDVFMSAVSALPIVDLLPEAAGPFATVALSFGLPAVADAMKDYAHIYPDVLDQQQHLAQFQQASFEAVAYQTLIDHDPRILADFPQLADNDSAPPVWHDGENRDDYVSTSTAGSISGS